MFTFQNSSNNNRVWVHLSGTRLESNHPRWGRKDQTLMGGASSWTIPTLNGTRRTRRENNSQTSTGRKIFRDSIGREKVLGRGNNRTMISGETPEGVTNRLEVALMEPTEVTQVGNPEVTVTFAADHLVEIHREAATTMEDRPMADPLAGDPREEDPLAEVHLVEDRQAEDTLVEDHLEADLSVEAPQAVDEDQAGT